MLRGQRKERRRRTWPPLTPTPVGEARQEATREALPGSCTTLGGLRRRLSLREPWMWEVAAAAAAAKSLQSSPTLIDRMDCSLSGSSIHGIFQARVLEWGAKLLRMPYMVLGDKTKCSRIQVTKDSEFLLVLGCVHCIGQWFSGQVVNWLQRPCHRQNQKTGLIKVYEKCVKNCYFICYC